MVFEYGKEILNETFHIQTGKPMFATCGAEKTLALYFSFSDKSLKNTLNAVSAGLFIMRASII